MISSDMDLIQVIEDGDIKLSPFDMGLVRPASICLRLGGSYLSCSEDFRVIDLKDKNTFPVYVDKNCDPNRGYVVDPGSFVLFNTLEKISISNNYSANLSNLSGLARLGLQVLLSTYVSPGFGGSAMSTITLEILNFNSRPIRIYPGMRICHLIFHRLSSPSANGYDGLVGTYSKQNLPRGSEFYREFIDISMKRGDDV